MTFNKNVPNNRMNRTRLRSVSWHPLNLSGRALVMQAFGTCGTRLLVRCVSGASRLTNSSFVRTLGELAVDAANDSTQASESIMKAARIPQKLQPWFEARKRYRLTHAQVQMARELGLNPKKFGGLANHRQEPWKLPLPNFIEELYLKRFGVEHPAEVISLEEVVSRDQAKKERKCEVKRQRLAQVSEQSPKGEQP